jgi:hypothetical protein
MKSWPIVLALVVTTLRGADGALPEFNHSIIGHPQLSLREIARSPTPSLKFGEKLPRSDDAANGRLLPERPRLPEVRNAPPRPRFLPKSGVGNMPVLVPNPMVDHKMVIKEPDPRVDFKMLIEPPAADKTTEK